LTETLQFNTSLQCLFLHIDKIGGNGVITLAEALHGHTSLGQLNLDKQDWRRRCNCLGEGIAGQYILANARSD
jgi:hypothetical protein